MAENYECPDNFKIFIWHPSIEHLQYFTWLALQSFVRAPISFVLGYLENEVRKAQEWKSVDLRKLNLILIPPKNLWGAGSKLIRENPDAIHVFQAFRGAKGYNYLPLILFALRKGIKVVVLEEAYTASPVGYFYDENPLLAHLKTWFRPILRYAIARMISAVSSSHKPCIMSLSLIAKEQFIRSGFAAETIFPFGYFVPRQQIIFENNTKSDTLRLIFVGALILRKGLDVLVQAVRNLHEQGYKVSLDIYGAGDAKKVQFLDLPIIYKGTLPFDQIQAVIAEHDVLILPSRHDGWGVVVNEALLQGVPVIASSRVGAKTLLESGRAGLVFESENVNDLTEKIKLLVEKPSLLKELQSNTFRVGEEILPEKGARYFLDAMLNYFYRTGPRPSAIWSNNDPSKK